MNFTDLEDAIRTWVVNASGLAESAVIFSDQPATSPAPAASIYVRLGGPEPVSPVDAETWTYNAAAELHEELEVSTHGLRRLQVELEAVAPPVTGDGTARELLAKCAAALSLSVVREPLNALGVGVVSAGKVRWVPVERGDRREGSAFLEPVFTVGETAAAKMGYLAKVKGKGTVHDGEHESEDVPFETT